jgi:DNA-binding transcriptional MerR regulator
MTAKKYTIGQVSRLSGLSVKKLRFYADKGLLAQLHRSESGYRLFGDEDIIRIDLIRALREAGLGLQAIRDVLAQKLSLKQVLTLRLEEIEAQLSAQRRVATALRAALMSPEPSNDDLRRVWIMANLTQSERGRVIEQFFTRVTENSSLDPKWCQWMVRMSTPEMPDDPTGEQLDAWVELSALIADPEFVRLMRENGLESYLGTMDFAAFNVVQKHVLARAAVAIEEGVDPASDVGFSVADEYLSGWATSNGISPNAEFFSRMKRKHLQHRPQMQRYWELVGMIGGEPGNPGPSAAWQWIESAAMLRLGAISPTLE